VSRLAETGKTPVFEIAPYEGRNPMTPQNPAGTLTPPTVSTPAIKYLYQMHIPKFTGVP
jgi:hypothetical protein